MLMMGGKSVMSGVVGCGSPLPGMPLYQMVKTNLPEYIDYASKIKKKCMFRVAV